MDNTIKALQNLYVALGGNLSTVSNLVIIPDMINALATLVAAGLEGTLPEVSSKDNGKVLKVVEGEWALGEDATTTG